MISDIPGMNFAKSFTIPSSLCTPALSCGAGMLIMTVITKEDWKKRHGEF